MKIVSQIREVAFQKKKNGVDEEGNEFILFADEEISLDTIVSAGTELAQRFIFKDCVIEYVGSIQTLHLPAECS